ncbi:amino acid permease [Pseudomonas vanderleydeniana]|uniref:Amino acid permease n=1 Tax=Pseudomonas vanderleydeniana TaxID=2745495 RepID=A0A9E6TTZ6_9PSED|nr:amino acid permease [Pseudomonas vanderleydeniana]QXI31213.1 amino acid permease [Pseudomonas vanderleydeniana]
MSREQNAGRELSRGLSNRHIQMIGLGGAIGTGLFLGSAGVIKSAGPGLLMGYALAGLIAFLIMRQLGEMLVDEPVSGSLSYFSKKYCSGFLGYLTGWNYIAAYILVGMAELTAIGKYIQFWWPDVPTWVTAAGFFIAINAMNLLNVRFYGEAEFWFALVKVVAIVAMIGFGSWLLFGPTQPADAALSNLWSHGGFLPHGLGGLLMAMPFIMFAFGGLEFIGFTAGEAAEPRSSIPRAINRVLYRIGIFYIAALAVLLALTPWDTLVASLDHAGDPYSASPFVKILSLLGSDLAAHLLNLVVLTAAMSVYNGVVYCNTRQLFAMAEQNQAPRSFLKLNRNRVPVNALLASALITGIAVVLNYFSPEGVIEILMSLTVSATVINWLLTSYTHLKFRKAKLQKGQALEYASPCHPLSNYLCIGFIVGLLLIMAFIPAIRIAVWLIPLWLLIVYASYRKYQLGLNQQVSYE